MSIRTYETQEIESMPGLNGHEEWYRKDDIEPLLRELAMAANAALNDRMFKDWPEIARLLMDAIEKAENNTMNI